MIAFSQTQTYWISKFFIVFGCLWLFFEPLALFFDELQGLRWGGYLLIVCLAAIATYLFFRPKKSFSVILPESNTKVSIAVSDLLEQPGSIVVGTSDTFDTELGEIINKNSLMGQFLFNVYQSDKSVLDAEISNALKDNHFETDSTKSFGKQNRYPIGTVACLQKNNSNYFLLAFNKMLSNEKRVTTDIGVFWEALSKCWDTVREKGHQESVHVPALGTKYARTGFPINVVIQLIIMSFVIANKQEEVSQSFTVHIHKSDANKVNFVSLKNWLDFLSGKI